MNCAICLAPIKQGQELWCSPACKQEFAKRVLDKPREDQIRRQRGDKAR